MRLPLAPAVFLFAGAVVLACAQTDLTAPNGLAEDALQPSFALVRACPPSPYPMDFVKFEKTHATLGVYWDDAKNLNGDNYLCHAWVEKQPVLTLPLPNTYVVIDNTVRIRKKTP